MTKDKGHTPLTSLETDLLEALEEMLEAYAPMAEDTVRKFGETALHSAVKRSKAAIRKARACCDYEADHHKDNPRGNTTLGR